MTYWLQELAKFHTQITNKYKIEYLKLEKPSVTPWNPHLGKSCTGDVTKPE